MSTVQDTTPYLLIIIKEVVNIIKVFDEGLSELNLTRPLFTQGNESDPTEIVGVATQTKKPG